MLRVQGAIAALSLFAVFNFARASEKLEGSFEVVELSHRALSAPVALYQTRTLAGTKAASGVGTDTCSADTQASPFRTTLSQGFSIPAALQAAGGQGGISIAGVPELAAVDVALDQIINIGKKVWTVVVAGSPVVNLKSDVATALPASAPNHRLCWTSLENWQAPKSRVFGVAFKNLFGVEVVRFQYRVLYLAGGSYEGHGRYIGYAAIQPSEVNVAWGYNLKVEASAPVVFNVGTKASPVAGMNLEVKYTIKTGLKEVTQSKVYYITGLGDFEELD